jgi:hypothetical protein
MRKIVAAVLGSTVVAGALVLLHHENTATAAPGAGGPAVVVELFSSEGCSSCPPADQYLRDLDRAQSVKGVTVIALEEHVDYWDGLGWKDPFSQATFSARQHDYSAVLPDHRVYTPELVIDGHAVIEGGDEERAARDMLASSRERKARVQLDRSGARVTINVTQVPSGANDDPAEVWLAGTEANLSTRVERGENAGRTLAHAPVVRALRRLGVTTSEGFHGEVPLEVSSSWNPDAVRAVVFVQRARSKRIIGAEIR